MERISARQSGIAGAAEEQRTVAASLAESMLELGAAQRNGAGMYPGFGLADRGLQ